MTTHIGDDDFLEFNQEADDNMEEMKGHSIWRYPDGHYSFQPYNYGLSEDEHHPRKWLRMFDFSKSYRNACFEFETKRINERFSEYVITRFREYLDYFTETHSSATGKKLDLCMNLNSYRHIKKVVI